MHSAFLPHFVWNLKTANSNRNTIESAPCKSSSLLVLMWSRRDDYSFRTYIPLDPKIRRPISKLPWNVDSIRMMFIWEKKKQSWLRFDQQWWPLISNEFIAILSSINDIERFILPNEIYYSVIKVDIFNALCAPKWNEMTFTEWNHTKQVAHSFNWLCSALKTQMNTFS